MNRDATRPEMLQTPLASSISSVLRAIWVGFAENWGVTCVYDPSLTVKKTLEGKIISSTSSLKDLFRKGKEVKEVTPPPTYPIFSWNRDPITLSETYGGKGSYGKIVHDTGDGETLDIYAGAVSSIKVHWRYITQNIAEMEQFEIMYMSKQGIRSLMYLDMMFFDQGPFKFELEWDSHLNNLQTNDDDFAFVSVGGELTITGPMIVIMGKVRRLEKVVFRLYVTSEESPICQIPLPRLVSHSVLEWEKVIHTDKEI